MQLTGTELTLRFRISKNIHMKKGILLILFIVFGVHIYGQVIDSIPRQGFSFPI